MTRADCKEALLYDPEIERIVKSLRKQGNLRNQTSKPSSSAIATNLVTAIQSTAQITEELAATPAAEPTTPAAISTAQITAVSAAQIAAVPAE